MGLKPWATTSGAVWSTSDGTIVTGLSDADNPLALRPYTMRLQFSDGAYDPSSLSWPDGAYWTQVTSSPNVWDFTYVNPYWYRVFKDRFKDRSNLVTVLGGNLLGVEEVYGMFEGDTALESVHVFDSSTITSMDYAFSGCTALSSIGLIDTSAVTSFDSFLCDCSRLSSIPAFDTSSAINTKSMCCGCASLSTISLFETNKVTDMSYMFKGCEELRYIPAMDTRSALYTYNMFEGCSSLGSIYHMNLQSVVNANAMFKRCTSLTTVPLFDLRHVVDAGEMFKYSGLTSVPLFRTDNMDDVRAMFHGCVDVESGALALYQQMSSQSIPPISYGDCFLNCGSHTTSGAEELGQIPTSWGGTME